MDSIETKAYSIFLQEIDGRIESMANCLKLLPDREAQMQLRIVAHLLKGGSLFFGLQELSAAAERVEEMAKQQQIDELHKQEIGTIIARLTEYAKQLKK